MIKRSLISAAILAISVTCAQATDDVPLGQEVATFDESRLEWSGTYYGLLVSYNLADDDWVDPALPPGSLFGTVDADGISGGVLVGHNWQDGDWVYGIEADFELASFGGWQQNPAVGWFGFAEMNWQGSVRGRLGKTVNGYNIYATAGLAVADFDLDYNGAPVHVGDRYSDTLVGWTVGAGAEGMLDNGLFGRVEYRYSDFGRSESTILNCCAAPPFRQRHDITSSKISFALIKKH